MPNSWPIDGRLARATISRRARSTTSRLVRAPDSFMASATTASSISMLVIMGVYCTCSVQDPNPSAQSDSRELALADLQHVRPSLELERLVADHGRVDAHAAAFDEAIGLAAGRRQPGLLEQLGNAKG